MSRLEPVRTPGSHVPGVDDCQRHDQRFGAGPQVDVFEQVMRQLPDREDVDEIEEQLERGDDTLSAWRPRDRDPHRRMLWLRCCRLVEDRFCGAPVA
jgi:hypothetical protein